MLWVNERVLFLGKGAALEFVIEMTKEIQR